MDKPLKISLKPCGLIETECESVELEIVEPASEMDAQLAEIDEKIANLSIEADKLTSHTDKLDYAVAVASGIITGLLDSFFVGETKPRSIDEIVESFAKKHGWSEDSKKSAQSFLECQYHTANDAAYQGGKDIIGKKLGVGGKTHRFDDAAHSPTLEGLRASIVVHFLRIAIFRNKNGETHFVPVESTPKDILNAIIPAALTGCLTWLAYMAENFNEEKFGNSVPSVIVETIKFLSQAPILIEILKCADTWFGHIMSDVGTTAGIPGMFLSFLKMVSCLPILNLTPFPKFVEKLYQDKKFGFANELIFAEVVSKQLLPVAINETLVRGFYFVRHLITEYKQSNGFENINWENVIPFGNRTVERMITVASGTFTAVDTLDALIEGAIHSGGTFAGFGKQVFLRLNFVGIGRFAIALGTDVVMGLSKDAKDRKTMLLKAEALYLMDAKLYHGETLVWSAAKDANESVDKLLEAMQGISFEIADGARSISDSVETIKALDTESIEKNNEGLTSELLEIL